MPRTVITLILAASAAVPGHSEQVAFIKDNHVYVSNDEGGVARQVDADPRPKTDLGWDRKRKRISYFVERDTSLARLVLVDLNGRQVADIKIRPDLKPPAGFMRFVEKSLWLPDGRLRLVGSINPSNCEQFDFDVASEEESNIQYGYCAGIETSPDGKHTAEISPVNQFVPEEERFQILLLDNNDLYFGEKRTADQAMFILAGPVWASDSQTIAILERKAVTGEAAVTFVKLNGQFMRIPVPRSVLDSRVLKWVGTKVVAGTPGVDELQIDAETGHIGGVTAEVQDQLSRRVAKQRATEIRRKNIAAAIDHLGGKEGISLDEDEDGSK